MSYLDKIWLIIDEATLDALDNAIYNDLIEAKLITGDRFLFKRYHPTKDLVTAPFKLGKVPRWDKYILKRLKDAGFGIKDLVKLTKDWEIEI